MRSFIEKCAGSFKRKNDSAKRLNSLGRLSLIIRGWANDHRHKALQVRRSGKRRWSSGNRSSDGRSVVTRRRPISGSLTNTDRTAHESVDALFNELEAGGPRLLFKGGTSLSKGYGLIERFSEDIDITVFQEDIGQSATVEELETLSDKQRNARLEAIKAACQTYI